MAEFQHGFCSCCEDCGTCCMTFFCHCIVSGQTAEAVGENCFLYGCLALTPCLMISNGLIRQKVREQHSIEGSLLTDILLHWCCACCAIIQDHREVKSHSQPPPAVAMARE